MSQTHAQITLTSPEETCRFAQRLGTHLDAGDVLLLQGDIGAGKTHFARCLIQSLLPAPEDVPSPTFTLVQTYSAPKFSIWHADLYRLSHPDEVVELGLTEAFETAVCLVEWPELLADLTPINGLTLRFTPIKQENSRQVNLTWTNPTWTTRLKDILDD